MLKHENPEPLMVGGQLAMQLGEKPKLIYKDPKGKVHTLTDDEMKAKAIRKLHEELVSMKLEGSLPFAGKI